MSQPVVYASDVDDNLRWSGIPLREGDIVVSTRSKHGTTWMQQVCVLLVFGDPDLPEPLATLSPWVDWRVEPLDDLRARLEGQAHRRILKTHTPLDGLPLDARATYVVVARHPLDAAVSLYHQGDNLDRARVAELMGERPPVPTAPRPTVTEWLRGWAVDPASPTGWLESPAGVLHHVTDAWQRRESALADPALPRVVLVHYADLSADLAGEMRRLAGVLDLPVPAERWSALVEAATFVSMRAQPSRSAPDPGGVMKSHAAFFRSGRSGGGRDLLEPAEVAAFEERCRALAPAEVVDWLLR